MNKMKSAQSMDNVERLEEENDTLKTLLSHAVYRTHKHSDGCSICLLIKEYLK